MSQPGTGTHASQQGQKAAICKCLHGHQGISVAIQVTSDHVQNVHQHGRSPKPLPNVISCPNDVRKHRAPEAAVLLPLCAPKEGTEAAQDLRMKCCTSILKAPAKLC